MSKQPFTQLYTSRNHLGKEALWVPGAAHSPEIIEHRKGRPADTLVYELQHVATQIAGRVFQLVHHRADIESAGNMIAPALFNSGRMTLARRTSDTRTSRSVNDLHQVAKPDTVYRDNPADVRTKTMFRFAAISELSNRVFQECAISKPTNKSLYRAGRALGNTGLATGLTVDMKYIPMGTDHEVQDWVRESGLRTVATTHELAEALTVAPSIAQLADRNSPLTTHWNNTATNGAYDALQQAQEEFQIPARY
jgi:hypothetical protein